MLIGPFGFEQLAQGDTQYSQINTLDWANGNRDVHYRYDDNGSLTEKITAVKDEADPDTNYLEKVTYDYDLRNRLWCVTTDDTSGTDAVVEYTYNNAGIKVAAHSYDTPDGGDTKQNEKTKLFLIDAYNHTGYAQVLEQWTDGAHPDITYTIGADIITQSSSAGVRHLLYDGHGSTRQLMDNDSEAIVDTFSYDAYGVMLGGNPAPGSSPATSLLYAGEQFDTDTQNYYLRARWYDQQTGRFNRMGPFAGAFRQ